LEGRRVRDDLIEVFKMINGLTNVKFEVFFEFDTSYRTSGHACIAEKEAFQQIETCVSTSSQSELYMYGTNWIIKLYAPIGFLAEQL